MQSVPPKPVEALIGLLIPPACREEVLGDLYQRYAGPRQYILDALRAVPLVILSRIRRTTDPAVCLMEALALCLSFLVAAWYIDPVLLSGQRGIWRLAMPVGAALLAMVLRDAYAPPGIKSRWEAGLRPVLGAACAFVVDLSWRAPMGIVLWGGVLSVLVVSPLRMMFPPWADLPQGAGGPPFWQRYVTGPLGLPPWMVRFAAAIMAGILVAALFYGRYKRS
jgi:hypothetical protein